MYREKNDLSLTYIFNDIVEAAMSDETWELPEESHRALCGVDAAFMLLCGNNMAEKLIQPPRMGRLHFCTPCRIRTTDLTGYGSDTKAAKQDKGRA